MLIRDKLMTNIPKAENSELQNKFEELSKELVSQIQILIAIETHNQDKSGYTIDSNWEITIRSKLNTFYARISSITDEELRNEFIDVSQEVIYGFIKNNTVSNDEIIYLIENFLDFFSGIKEEEEDENNFKRFIKYSKALRDKKEYEKIMYILLTE